MAPVFCFNFLDYLTPQLSTEIRLLLHQGHWRGSCLRSYCVSSRLRLHLLLLGSILLALRALVSMIPCLSRISRLLPPEVLPSWIPFQKSPPVLVAGQAPRGFLLVFYFTVKLVLVVCV